MIKYLVNQVPPLGANCYTVYDAETKNCLIIDLGGHFSTIISQAEKLGLTIKGVLLTHGHFDHIYGASALVQKYDIPAYAHINEKFTIENTNPQICRLYDLSLPAEFAMTPVSEGEVIEVGDLRFEVIETPGHSQGGLCFYEKTEGVLFSGDTLFAGAIGRTDQPGGDYDLLMKSIFEKLMVLDGSVTVIPGHGPETSIATERMTNPFLMPFNEPYED